MFRPNILPYVLPLVLAALLGCDSGSPPSLALEGSGTSSPASPSTPAATSSVPVQGVVHGGDQPVAGAHVYLFAASSSGYGAASVPLLNSTLPGVYTDATGPYVLSDATGAFSVTGDYTCTPGQQVYLLSLGGNPGPPATGDNPALALLNVLGACPANQSSLPATEFVALNEVTTAATAYALAGFFTDATHLASAATPNALSGLANAVLSVSNLVDVASGTALARTPAGNGVAPQATLNTLANILVPCVNSDGAGSAACAALFAAAAGAPGTTAPATTADAVLNIAHNPGAGVAALYGLAGSNFQPALTAAPNDFTLSLTFGAPSIAAPYFPAIDAEGNLWVPSFLNATLTELGPLGQPLSGSAGFTGGGLNEAFAVAIDPDGNPWVTNFAPLNASTVSKFLANGTPATPTPYACSTACYFPAFDAAGNLWVSGSGRATVLSTGLPGTSGSSGTPAGTLVKSFATSDGDSGIAIDASGGAWLIGAPGVLDHLALPAAQTTIPEGVTSADGGELTTVAIDGAGNVWFASGANDALGEVSSSGALVSPQGGYTGGGLDSPAQIAVDGSGRVWAANRDGNSLSAFTNAGATISPAKGYQAANLSNPRGLALDASGNAWLTSFTNNSVTEFVGIASPTATPIMPTNHGQRP